MDSLLNMGPWDTPTLEPLGVFVNFAWNWIGTSGVEAPESDFFTCTQVILSTGEFMNG